MMKYFSRLAFAAIVVSASGTATNGAVLVSSTGPAQLSFATSRPGNDDPATIFGGNSVTVSGNAAVAFVNNTFQHTWTLTAQNSSGDYNADGDFTTEYRLTATLRNNTGVAWSGLKVRLNNRPMANPPSFEGPKATGGGILYPAWDQQALSSVVVDELLWSNVALPNTDGAFLTLLLDIPNSPGNSTTTGSYTFDLEVTAIVPEPSALAASGLLLLTALARRLRV